MRRSAQLDPGSFPTCEGAYLADLFTWLAHQGYASPSSGNTAYSPARVLWYHGADKPDSSLSPNEPPTLGLYQSTADSSGAGAKPLSLNDCGGAPHPHPFDTTIAELYTKLQAGGACY